jgi:hypothetical protein
VSRDTNTPDPHFHQENQEGLLVYIKPSLTGDEPPDLLNYAAQHLTFPHESTLNQFFTESQFESYRALGYHCARETFQRVIAQTNAMCSNCDLFKQLYDSWYPPPQHFTNSYLESNREYLAIQRELRTNQAFGF